MPYPVGSTLQAVVATQDGIVGAGREGAVLVDLPLFQIVDEVQLINYLYYQKTKNKK
jgi:hypothetical protein